MKLTQKEVEIQALGSFGKVAHAVMESHGMPETAAEAIIKCAKECAWSAYLLGYAHGNDLPDSIKEALNSGDGTYRP